MCDVLTSLRVGVGRVGDVGGGYAWLDDHGLKTETYVSLSLQGYVVPCMFVSRMVHYTH